jgi:hypothetical protein
MCFEMKWVLRRQCNLTNKPKGWSSPSILTPLVPFQWCAHCMSVSIRFGSEQRTDANEKFNRFSFLTWPHVSTKRTIVDDFHTNGYSISYVTGMVIDLNHERNCFFGFVV